MILQFLKKLFAYEPRPEYINKNINDLKRRMALNVSSHEMKMLQKEIKYREDNPDYERTCQLRSEEQILRDDYYD